VSGYFDANATTPLFPVVRERYLSALDQSWANPSSLHHAGGAVRRQLEEAREELAELLGVEQPSRIVFLSGATESANIVFRHAAATSGPDAKVLLSPLEHPCVREAAALAFPGRVVEAPIHPSGEIDLTRFEECLAHYRPVLASVMAANNETGGLQPWEEIQRQCSTQPVPVPFHCDTAQWLGKMPICGLGQADWLTGSSHKFGGPKGVGFLVVPEGLKRLHGTSAGGSQESGLRAGTENAPGIIAMVTALEAASNFQLHASGAGRDAFERRILDSLPGTQVVGGTTTRLWNTSMLVMPTFSNLSWLTRLSHLGFQLSTGSACSAGKGNPSHVMEAMGLTHDEMGRVLRASALWETTLDDWLTLAGAMEQVWEELQRPSDEGRAKRKIRF
jgi:cysteine desulfurase